jgi:hypothetical protein
MLCQYFLMNAPFVVYVCTCAIAELEIRIHKCTDIMSVHYQFCTDIFKICSDINFSDSVATIIAHN